MTFRQMAPEIFFSVCYGTRRPPQAICQLHTFSPAILDGHCRHRVRLADYPAVVRQEGHSVRGIYATGLTDANIDKLDRFEGDEYERVEVEVREGEGTAGEAKKAFVYLFLKGAELEAGEWDFEAFRRDKMEVWTRQRWDEVEVFRTAEDDPSNTNRSTC